MDNLCELTAAAVTWRIDGHECRLSPLRLVDWGEIEREFAGATAEAVSQPGRTLEQLARLLETSAGQELTFWLCLRRNHPDVTRKEASELLRQAQDDPKEFARRWPQLTGIPPNHSTLSTPHSTLSAIFLRLSSSYGWSPQQIGELTLPQLLAYLRDEPDERRTMWMTPAEARAWRAIPSIEGGGCRATQVPRCVVENDSDGASTPRGAALRSDPRHPATEGPVDGPATLKTLVNGMAEVRNSLRRLERREDVARYATPDG